MRRWIPPLIILATLTFTAAVYDGLPERMPVHWNARGEVDRSGSRFWGAFGLPLFRSNWFMGIRTPWTLSSDAVWRKTHRLGGYLMVGVGLLLIAAGLPGSAAWLAVAIGGAMAMAVVVVLYSFLAWRAEKGRQ